MSDFTIEEWDKMFEPMEDLSERWEITEEEAEVFLEQAGYYRWHGL